MNDTKQHTPGPWRITDYPQLRILDPDGYHVAETFGRRNPGEEEANALLIAAAPDLLAALERVCNPTPTYSGQVSIMEQARAALARARGEK